MIKMIAFLKRRPGMSVEDFRSYYEEVHARIGEKHLQSYITRYVRRYLQPLPGETTGMANVADDYDVVTEIWYPDQDTLNAAVEHLSSPDVAAEVLADEEQLFDRSRTRFYLVDEQESAVT